MQRLYIFTALLGLTGCANAYQQPYAVPQPPTITQMQGQCFSNFKQFAAQTKCIANAISGITASGIALHPGMQEYLLLMESLQEKVAHKKLSASDARLKLAGKLSELRALQQNELAVQEQLENQRAMQTLEILRQNQPKPIELYVPPKPTVTDCNRLGSNVHCTSRQW